MSLLALLGSLALSAAARDPVIACVEGNYTCDGECLADGQIVPVHEYLNELQQYRTPDGVLTQFVRNNIAGGPVSAETEDCAHVPGTGEGDVPVHMQCATTIDNRSSDYPVVIEDHYFASDCKSFTKVVRGQNSQSKQRGMVCKIKCVEH
eukprot:4822410-Prymnesium_polylepis.2